MQLMKYALGPAIALLAFFIHGAGATALTTGLRPTHRSLQESSKETAFETHQRMIYYGEGSDPLGELIYSIVEGEESVEIRFIISAGGDVASITVEGEEVYLDGEFVIETTSTGNGVRRLDDGVPPAIQDCIDFFGGIIDKLHGILERGGGVLETKIRELASIKIKLPKGIILELEFDVGGACNNGCANGDNGCDDPHMHGLRGQHIEWSGIDGGWYSMVTDDKADFHVNVRVTAPLPDEFPDRQLMTGLAVLSEGHSLVIEVTNPYTIDTKGCPQGLSPCLANGGLSIFVDGQEVNELLRFSRLVPVADGAIQVSASNLPVECRQFGGDKIWARMYQEMVEGKRRLASAESLEDWILRYDQVAAPGWCAKYIAENDLADLQSTHAIFKIDTPTVVIRLNAGVNYQGDGEVDWDGRVLPDLEFWQMDIGMNGLDVDNPALSGLLGETAHPVYDNNGKPVMEGSDAFRGTVEDYRVSDALGVHFPLLDGKE